MVVMGTAGAGEAASLVRASCLLSVASATKEAGLPGRALAAASTETDAQRLSRTLGAWLRPRRRGALSPAALRPHRPPGLSTRPLSLPGEGSAPVKRGVRWHGDRREEPLWASSAAPQVVRAGSVWPQCCPQSVPLLTCSWSPVTGLPEERPGPGAGVTMCVGEHAHPVTRPR